jgi:hypothetical protein
MVSSVLLLFKIGLLLSEKEIFSSHDVEILPPVCKVQGLWGNCIQLV